MSLITRAAGFTLFALLTAAVHARLLAGSDLALLSAVQSSLSDPLDTLSEFLDLLFSIEGSFAYALLARLVRWKRGLGRWSFTPFLFVALVPIELIMKMTVLQPHVPQEFHRSTGFPLVGLHLAGSFPSGHSIRAGFLCTSSAIHLWPAGGKLRRIAAAGFALLAALTGFSRVYLGVHWPSDAIGGLILGASSALLLRTPGGGGR